MKRDLLERFYEKIDIVCGCWLWIGWRDRYGYGHFWFDGLQVKAHRWAYERFVAPIPIGLEIDHLCRVTWCVNPSHLEPVTREENMRRRYLLVTHCINGHEFTPENTYVRSDSEGVRRCCRACNSVRVKEYKQRKMLA